MGKLSGVEEREPDRREPKDQDLNPLPPGLDSVRLLKVAWCAGGSINTNTKTATESLPWHRAFLLPNRRLGKEIQFRFFINKLNARLDTLPCCQ